MPRPLAATEIRDADSRADRADVVRANVCATSGIFVVGLLDLDASSVRHAPKGWKPRATLIELLTNRIARN